MGRSISQVVSIHENRSKGLLWALRAIFIGK